jgi:hypothetical protein
MFPINGRVAIVDDQIEQVKFLIDDLSKHHIAFRVYDGKVENLPEEEVDGDDFRVLFLDLNLSGNKEISDKEMISTLYGVLNRLIPSNNYPYVLVYWSRHEDKRNLIESELFSKNLLGDKNPIAFISADKADYFDLDGNSKDVTSKIYEQISKKLQDFPAYHALLEWENLIHKSADKTIQDIFKFEATPTDVWSKASLELLSRFLIANMGSKNAYACTDNQIKLKSSLNVLNNIFLDSLESQFIEKTFIDTDILEGEKTNLIDISYINTKLLIDQNNNQLSPGMVCCYEDQSNLKHLLNDLQNMRKIQCHVQSEDEETWAKSSNTQRGKLISKHRETIRNKAKHITISVDPQCDFIQQKIKYQKFSEGALLLAKYAEFIDNSSEGIFISPSFKYDDDDYVLVLSLKHLNSKDLPSGSLPFSLLFRVRQTVLSEIQSKLARFINRQGILFL